MHTQIATSLDTLRIISMQPLDKGYSKKHEKDQEY